ncbi:MAG: hypothetical protein ACLRWQ_13205 [Flavonifractor plautii]
MKDNAMTVEQHIVSVAKTLGGTITFKNAVRFEKGEGIEKKQENSPKRSLSSWASKPQIKCRERWTLECPALFHACAFPRPPPAGRAAWCVRCFCRRQTLIGGFISPQSNENRAPRPACGKVELRRRDRQRQRQTRYLAALPDTEVSGAFPCLRSLSCARLPAGRAAWRVQAFCRRQNLGLGRIHFAPIE